jgi:hypothetical protein
MRMVIVADIDLSTAVHIVTQSNKHYVIRIV